MRCETTEHVISNFLSSVSFVQDNHSKYKLPHVGEISVPGFLGHEACTLLPCYVAMLVLSCRLCTLL